MGLSLPYYLRELKVLPTSGDDNSVPACPDPACPVPALSVPARPVPALSVPACSDPVCPDPVCLDPACPDPACPVQLVLFSSSCSVLPGQFALFSSPWGTSVCRSVFKAGWPEPAGFIEIGLRWVGLGCAGLVCWVWVLWGCSWGPHVQVGFQGRVAGTGGFYRDWASLLPKFFAFTTYNVL